ncbi:O-antigen ligase family protein [Limisphaera ngatamarikiensis]|uniref:O-antigen ligase family protein n=1 Tax=Limisphaera ngatamarikiensis TaxID=1324935 RepID=A0A6M1RV60_9BACT|nr:O-antigen ligase family protein [Limisphaera ngatamarikiensis]NGO39254.1 O-antigen ligase family protein [Limisphaera ngatamarikiensis]
MTPLALLFLLAAVMAIWTLPRQWAPVPLLAAACYMTLGQGIEVAGLNFPVIRLVLLAGVVRVLIRGERPAGGWIGMDKLFLAWAAWAILVSFFHKQPGATLQFHLGMVYNALCVYFLLRCFCQDEEDVYRLVRVSAWILVPVALEMLHEQVRGQNLFAVFGAVPDEPAVRNGRIRSQGPFAHAILAGTVGAVCIPMLVGLWRRYPITAKVGLAACGLMVLASASSGPLLSVLFSLAALGLWRWRYWTRQMRIAAVLGYILLDLVMKAPAYYLIARIDLTGGSSSYHRAALIQAAIEHFSEWWRTGTDYTRHWLPYGVPWSEDHVDITNHYLGQGVKGGLPLMLLFISLLWCGFRYVGQAMQNLRGRDPGREFFAWAVGAGLFAHAASCVSVAYFDQSILFLYLTLALTAALKVNWGWAPASASRAERAASYDLPAVTPTEPALPGAGASGWVPASSGPHEKPGI